jgi:glycosyltransferase involved in cell wall biosynthesis
VFGNLARLAPNKDHETLIAAFTKIKDQCPNAKIYILGDGSLEATLKAKVSALKFDKDIIFKGYVPLAYRYLKAFEDLDSI